MMNYQSKGTIIGKINLPSKISEKWRKVDIKRIKNFIDLPITCNSSIKDNSIHHENIKEASESYRILLNNGFSKISSSDLPQGINFLNQEEIKKNAGKSLNYLDHKDDWILDFANASNPKIIGLKISKENVTSLEIILNEEKDSIHSSRLLILVEEEAKIDLIEVITGENNSAHNNLVEIYMSKGSTMNHGIIAIGQKNSGLLAKRAVAQEVNSSYSLKFFQEGWRLARIEPEIVQINGNAKTVLKGLQVARDDQQLSTFSIVRFNGPNGILNQLQKALVESKSHSIFNGVVEVPQVAQKTNATQLSKNLLLSNKSIVDTKPELRIVADDVKCSHGATISELEEDELFYLQSRGLSVDDAKQLILKGYAQEIIDDLPVEASRWKHLTPLLN